MNCYLAVPILLASCCGARADAAGKQATAGDAYARGSADGQRWSVGTRAVSMAFECRDGKLRLASFQNRLAGTPCEYVDPLSAAAPLTLDGEALIGPSDLQTVWVRHLAPGGTGDPSAEHLRLDVKQGDLVGFAAASRADDGDARVEWATTVAYDGGATYSSLDDPASAQGATWDYCLQATGTGCLVPLDETVAAVPGATEAFRVPGGYRAPAECPKLGATTFQLLNALTLIRVWKAPTDGAVTVSGAARHVGGGSPVDVSVLRIREAPNRGDTGEDGFGLEGGAARRVAVGGRPAVELELALRRRALRIRLRVLAYPGTSILRQSLEFENAGPQPLPLGAPAPLLLSLRGEDAGSPYSHYWMCGGTSRPNQGQLRSATVASTYHQALVGEKSDNYVPWTALLRDDAPGDGLFVALDYLGTWSLNLDREASGPMRLTAGLPALAGRVLEPGERLALPTITLGVFHGRLDDMGVRVYDWQYEYMWDRTNGDYYARTKWAVPWFFCSRNLQEQFCARLATLDMDADVMRAMGFEMLWDDAGWSKYPGWPEDSYATVFNPTHEGPDFAQTRRYLAKMGMTQLVWFAGRPSAGLLDGKVGSWGNFQWRTDGVGRFGPAADAAFRAQVEHFLTANPRCSFHTCDGGSRYAHQFDIQRLADVNYLSDLGRGDETNYYFSYLELPDKWLDSLDPLLNPGARFDPATSRRQLTMAPVWGMAAAEPDREPLRRMTEIYRYLRREGVVGRWSHTFHPVVVGDSGIYYSQRTSYDCARACIVLKHRADGEVTVYPRGLLDERRYTVGFDSRTDTTIRSGADLMANGIVIRNQAPGELIYLGLPDRPGGGADKIPPGAPGRVLTRRETNIGHQGVGVYWSAGADSNWVSYYEVRRDARVLGKVSAGAYLFDHAAGWDPCARYAVRTVDGDGNASDWTLAQPLEDEPLAASALGGHFAEAGREGWSAETTGDERTFSPMEFVPPARNPSGDLGGTPNQPGGVEGYWEGASTARVGRGWQQASQEAACVRSWTAPRSGTVRLIGRAMKETYHQDMGGSLRVHILHGTEPVWPQSGWAEVPLHDLVGVTHDLTLPVRGGDAIRFVLDRSDAPDGALLAWMPRVLYVDEEPSAAPASVVRILCGSATPFTDSQGNGWSADRFFRRGRPMRTAAPIECALPTPADQALYQAGRQGKAFTYAIPVVPGLYTLRLKFAERSHEWSFERPLNLSINGREVLRNYDVCQAARGPRRAHERVFRYLAPDAEGRLVLTFTGGFEPRQRSEQAMVQAIEVLPELKPTVRVDCGSDAPFVDSSSFVWSADEPFEEGQVLRSDAPVSQASPTLHDQRLYQTARRGRDLQYVIPVSPGLYTVHLKFAELWLAQAGQRPMHVEINGRRACEEWDPAVAAGQLGMAADVRVEDVTPDHNGRITIRVTAAGANDAILQGIEVE